MIARLPHHTLLSSLCYPLNKHMKKLTLCRQKVFVNVKSGAFATSFADTVVVNITGIVLQDPQME